MAVDWLSLVRRVTKTRLVLSFAVYLALLSIPCRSQESECEEFEATFAPAYIGWPVLLNCEELTYECVDLEEYNGTAFCIMTIIESNETFFNKSYNPLEFYDNPTNELSQNTPVITSDTDVELKLWKGINGTCCTQRVTLQPAPLQNYTCEEAENITTNVFPRNNKQNDPMIFLCEVIQNSQPALDVGEYDVTWYFNCNKTLPDGVDYRSKTKLEITSADYQKHSGVYTCSVQENGQERFIISHSVCLKPDAYSPLVAIYCPEELPYDEGGTINITCDVDITDGELDSDRYFMRFYPLLQNGSLDSSKDDISCTSFLGGNRTTAPDERVSCIFSYVSYKSDPQCFSYKPTEEEWETEKNKTLSRLHMSYERRNMRDGDAGKIQSLVRKEISKDSANDETIVYLATHPDNTATIVGCTVAGVVLLLLIVALSFVFRLEIRYWWRNTRCSKYEDDVRQFGAYFAYYWRNDAGERDQNLAYENLIMNTRKRLDQIGCPVYDINEASAQFQWQLENIQAVQQMCDRVIIILTPEYVNDEDNNFELFANFLDSNFVFIKTPGVDEALNRLDKQRRTAISIHLKRNYVIKWRGNNDRLSRRSQMKLELAMPKRRRVEAAAVYENGGVIMQ